MRQPSDQLSAYAQELAEEDPTDELVEESLDEELEVVDGTALDKELEQEQVASKEPAEEDEATAPAEAEEEEEAAEAEDSLDDILRRQFEGDLAEEEEEEEGRGRKAERGEEIVPLRNPEEFLCSGCFLIKLHTQLADPARSLCEDCASTMSTFELKGKDKCERVSAAPPAA